MFQVVARGGPPGRRRGRHRARRRGRHRAGARDGVLAAVALVRVVDIEDGHHGAPRREQGVHALGYAAVDQVPAGRRGRARSGVSRARGASMCPPWCAWASLRR